jgi:hypothetical protein
MANPLIEKIRRARQQTVTCDKYSFTVRRPTNLEMLKLKGRADQETLLRQFVTGWDNMTELDIYSGGTGAAVPFDSDLFVEWIADRPHYWEPITQAIVDAYQQHDQQLGEQLKN